MRHSGACLVGELALLIGELVGEEDRTGRAAEREAMTADHALDQTVEASLPPGRLVVGLPLGELDDVAGHKREVLAPHLFDPLHNGIAIRT